MIAQPRAAAPPRALIIVLGDLGRSPRMLNHARALRSRGWQVTLTGYGVNPPSPDLVQDPGVEVRELDAGGRGIGRRLWQLTKEVRRGHWTIVLVQNPPGFPALLVLGLLPRRGERRILDWHNVGSSLLSLRSSPRRFAAGFYGWCERRSARIADEHWAVSAVMAERSPGGSAVVVHDRPARVFRQGARARSLAVTHETRAAERLAWWKRVLPDVPPPEAECWVVAPSSWGPDEDMSAILRVAAGALAEPGEWGDGPRIAIIATGQGPAQAEFARVAPDFCDGPVTLHPAWIPAAEYPAFIAQADAGLCLHRSSSGLDLPMKLADFRGARRKALVLDYGPVLAEVFRPEIDGWTFRSDAELAAGLKRVACLPPEERVLEWAPEDNWEAEWERKLGDWASDLEAEVAGK